MTNISFGNRIKTIFDLVMSQSFFVTLFVILVLTVAILVVNIKIKSKAPKYMSIIACTGVGALVLARYGKYVLSLNDSIVDKFFRAAYFPNVVVYLSMLIITVLLLAYVLIDNRFTIYTKICTFLCFFITWFLFVLVVDTVKKEKLNFYEVKELYANKDVMVVLQASMFVFIIWSAIVIVDIVVRKLAHKMDEKRQLNEDQSEEYSNSFKKIDVDLKEIDSIKDESSEIIQSEDEVGKYNDDSEKSGSDFDDFTEQL